MIMNMNNSIIALGFFESLHIGHQYLFKALIDKSKSYCNLTPYVITFDDNFYNLLKVERKYIYLSEERIEIFNKLSIENVIVLNSQKTLLLNANEFLNGLIKNYNAKSFVVGENFLLGKDKQGINFLSEFCKLNGIKLYVIKLLKSDNHTVSSSLIRDCLINGDIKMSNKFLGRYFSVEGIVEKGRKEGRKHNYNTANLKINEHKELPQNGVYSTLTKVDGKLYKSITHIGPIPTYNIKSSVLETHILDFNSNIYGKKIKIYFLDKIRDIKKFDNKKDLYKQIEFDIESSYVFLIKDELIF